MFLKCLTNKKDSVKLNFAKILKKYSKKFNKKFWGKPIIKKNIHQKLN